MYGVTYSVELRGIEDSFSIKSGGIIHICIQAEGQKFTDSPIDLGIQDFVYNLFN